jgi:hypothetical protein
MISDNRIHDRIVIRAIWLGKGRTEASRTPLKSLGRIGQMKTTPETARQKAASTSDNRSEEEEIPIDSPFLTYHMDKGTFDDPCVDIRATSGEQQGNHDRLAEPDGRRTTGNIQTSKSAYPDARYINGQFLAILAST